MADCVQRKPVLRKPLGRNGVQLCQHASPALPELELQEFGEQLVIAKPGAASIERNNEGILGLELLQNHLGSWLANEGICHRAIHTLKDRGAKKQAPNRFGLTVQHLGEEVLGDGTLAARELR